jgi:hypothetical protein
MEIAFDAIGIEIASEAAFNDLAEDVGKRGEASRLARKSGVLHGRCLKLGEGLEVWSVLYESASGEISYTDCRPGFRARYAHKISPWVMTEFDEDGESVIHGFFTDTESEVLFELQNLTEVGTRIFNQRVLQVSLCGLAYRAEVLKTAEKGFWRAFDEISLNIVAEDNDWSLCGEVLAFNSLKNNLSGNDLYWIYLDLGEFKLEILVNQRALKGEQLRVGAFLNADIWLQGHILSENAARKSYEGVDRRTSTVDFWKNFKRPN